MKQALAILTLTLLTTCAGFNMEFHAHNLNYPRELGTSELVTQGDRTAEIHWVDYHAAKMLCAKYLPGTDAASCMIWKTDRSEIKPGVHCIGYVIPNRTIIEHEFKRCFDENYNVGIIVEHQ